MKKLVALLVAITFLIGLVAGCSSAAPAETTTKPGVTSNETTTTSAQSPKKIGVIYWSLNNNFMVFLKDNIEAEAKTLGYECFAMDSKSSTITELSNIEDLIAKKVDAVILVPMDSEASKNGIKLLNKANIPVVTVDRFVPDADVITQIASDNYAGGKVAGEFAVKKLNGKGNVVILRGVLGTNLETERYTGFTDVLAASKDITVVAVQEAKFDRTTAFNTMENVLQAHPEVNLVYAENDEMCLGVAKSLEAANRKDVMVIGFDGAQETLQAIKDGKVTGTVFQQFGLIGKTSVDVIDKVFKGTATDVAKEMPIECQFASADNLDQYLK